eukprot:s606_g17.t3
MQKACFGAVEREGCLCSAGAGCVCEIPRTAGTAGQSCSKEKATCSGKAIGFTRCSPNQLPWCMGAKTADGDGCHSREPGEAQPAKPGEAPGILPAELGPEPSDPAAESAISRHSWRTPKLSADKPTSLVPGCAICCITRHAAAAYVSLEGFFKAGSRSAELGKKESVGTPSEPQGRVSGMATFAGNAALIASTTFENGCRRCPFEVMPPAQNWEVQSMLLRLPSGLSQKQLYEYIAHVIKAQKKNNVKIFTAAPSAVEAAEIKSLLGESDVVDRLTVISGGMEARPGEAVLAENGACALAEAARDAGEDALLLLDLEQLFKVWNLLAEVSSAEHLTEIADTNLKKEINGLTQDLGIELWKYVARKNAASGRRRTFLGCFLQRAGRMSQERGGGSLTLLAFARLKDTSMLSRLELEAKLRNLMDMELDEVVCHSLLAMLSVCLSTSGREVAALGGDEFAAMVERFGASAGSLKRHLAPQLDVSRFRLRLLREGSSECLADQEPLELPMALQLVILGFAPNEEGMPGMKDGLGKYI